MRLNSKIESNLIRELHKSSVKYFKLGTFEDKERVIRDPPEFALNSIRSGRCKRTVPNERLKSGHSTSLDGTVVAGDIVSSINKDHRWLRVQIILPNRLPSNSVHFCTPKMRDKGPGENENCTAGR